MKVSKKFRGWTLFYNREYDWLMEEMKRSQRVTDGILGTMKRLHDKGLFEPEEEYQEGIWWTKKLHREYVEMVFMQIRILNKKFEEVSVWN